MYAAVAQLDRVTDYESVGRGFESLSPYHLKTRNRLDSGLFSIDEAIERDKTGEVAE